MFKPNSRVKRHEVGRRTTSSPFVLGLTLVTARVEIMFRGRRPPPESRKHIVGPLVSRIKSVEVDLGELERCGRMGPWNN